MLNEIVHSLSRLPGLHDTLDALGRGEHVALTGCGPSLLAALVRWYDREYDRPVLVIAPHAERADQLFLDLRTFFPEGVALFSPHTGDADELMPNLSVNLERMETLTGLLAGQTRIVVAPCLALLQDVPPPASFSTHILSIAEGQSMDLHDLLHVLTEQGYERSELVEFRGDFSARGGIVDLFPVTADEPVRIEFFGDEIVSIRSFEIHTQRSADEKLPSVRIPPARESSVVALEQAGAAAQRATLLEYFSVPPLIVWHEFRHALDEAKQWQENQLPGMEGRAAARLDDLLRRCTTLPTVFAQELELDTPEQYRRTTVHIGQQPLNLVPQSGDSGLLAGEKPHQYCVRMFARRMREWAAHGDKAFLLCASEAERERVTELFKEEALMNEAEVRLVVAPLSAGFYLPESRIAVVTEDEVFQRRFLQRRRARRHHRPRSAPIENIATIEPGAYIVHINHGIGQFDGIRLVELDGVPREMIVIKYADDARLYVPLEQAHLIERYVSVGDMSPELDTLGGGRWAARKRRAEDAVFDLAAELLERQAQREAQPGFAFSRDGEWQRSFERAFPFEETPDQDRAIEDVKADMEAPRPMDRLLCGDVGFGKTEVAIRAAFKAVLDGRQVALLVPTTVLAQQHWHTFTERMAEYPVRVAVLSRFILPREQKHVLRGVADGSVDILIGTHRLLSADMRFKQLGLLIVDEEQRFGVRHKERLKKLSSQVDVLALSATPIPRTLYGALTGARDMSTIMTPPEDRIPIKTLLIKRDERIIREALMHELARGGQVFFIHNRIETIGTLCERLKKLVPSARYVIGHGQMHEDQLAETMEDFVARKYDVLICTTIVESGLDLPNVNTIFVDNAERFGLADLYQLRGRVGRYNRQAYAYLIVNTDLALDSAARQRLKAILENTALGSGYAIAMKDLEIRGAGNLLGPQQSGHIAAIGFNLYCKLLKRAVDLLKSGRLQPLLDRMKEREREAAEAIQEAAGIPPEEPLEEPLEELEERPKRRRRGGILPADWRKEIPEFQPGPQPVDIRLPFSGNLPEEYIASPALRLELFRRTGLASRVQHLQAIEEEMRDRFGPLPQQAVLLLRLAEVRLHARTRGIDCIEMLDGKLILRHKGAIANPTTQLPRIAGMKPLNAVDVILAQLERCQPGRPPSRRE
ncbi:transcription-repair coupling factor [bacterium]|nr:transcription-repair coupling factor [bacterium]